MLEAGSAIAAGHAVLKPWVLGRLAEGTRRAAKAWGLQLLCKDPRWYSHSLTVIEVPKVGSMLPGTLPACLPACAEILY